MEERRKWATEAGYSKRPFSKSRAEVYPAGWVQGLNDASTKLECFFRGLLAQRLSASLFR